MTFPWRGWTMTGDVILLMSRGRGSWNDVSPIHHDTYILQVGVKGEEPFPGEAGKKDGDRFVVTMNAPKGGGPHPTIKSEIITADIIQRIAVPGAIVYDPFAGSGTTLIACEQTGRAARCIEIEPRYCDIILARFEQATGKTAQLLE
jgi:DNA modification methylase